MKKLLKVGILWEDEFLINNQKKSIMGLNKVVVSVKNSPLKDKYKQLSTEITKQLMMKLKYESNNFDPPKTVNQIFWI